MNRLRRLPHQRTNRGDRRGGYIMMVVIITMTVIILTLIAMVRQATIVANAVRMHKEKSQVAWILESGIERAKVRRAMDPEFTSETWSADVASDGREPAAFVELRIHDDSKLGTAISVEVTVAKKSRPNLKARKTVPFSLPTTAKK